MKRICYFAVAFVLAMGCAEEIIIDGIPFTQYADSVIGYSSQYSAGNWSASKALGKENVYDTAKPFFNYGDNNKAWSPSTADANREYLVLGFDTLQTVQIIEIYETWYPGAIDTVYLRNVQSGKWEMVYKKEAITDLPPVARKFTIFLPQETTDFVDAIRIALNSPAVSADPNISGWNEIDAVAITGQRKKND